MGQARFDADGTQAPPPPPAFGDPLAGLVTGSTLGHGGARDSRDDDIEVEIAAPVEPDQEVVKGMVDAALTGERDDLFGKTRSKEAAPDVEQAEEAKEPEPAEQPAETGTQPAPTQPAASKSIWPGQPQLMRAFRPRHRDEGSRPATPVRKPSAGSAGLAVAIVLLVVFGVLVIQLLSSIIDSFSGMFE